AAALNISGSELIGSRLQDDYKVHLSGVGAHSSVDVTIQSLTPDTCLVAPTANSAPSASIVRTIGSDDFAGDFVVDALDGLTPGVLCQLQATATGYETATFTSTVVQPGIEIRQLHGSMPSTAPNDPFAVFIGVPTSNGRELRFTQRLRKGTVDLPIK